MIKKIIFLICNILINNNIIVKFKNSKLKNLEYNYDFLNVSFEDLNNSKKILFSKKYLNTKDKFYDESSINYHTFNWLFAAKKIGGAEVVTIAKKQIFNWNNKKYKITSFVWNINYVAKRLISLIYNFDFYAISSTIKEKKIYKMMIVKHFFILNLQTKIIKNINHQSIEVTKALLLFSLINKLQHTKILRLINNQIRYNIDENGFHKSINPCLQAEYINHLYEIKNMCLFFKLEPSNEINFQIMNMSSLLKNLFHKDNTIALFNGSNNANYDSIIKINNLYKDIKPKNLNNIKNGLAVFDYNKLKFFFDITKPTSKLLNQNLHAGTLSFEMSYDNEKIITNCGSIEKRIGKKPEFLRYSAAHSTIILNNTNISELVEKKSYKRIPQTIEYNYYELKDSFLYEAIHDGYKDNLKSIIKRKIFISKKNTKITGEDTIISTKLNAQKKIYSIRFHLTPNCSCLITNNKKSILIKTISKTSWVFKSVNKLTLEDSIYINDGKRINKTKQIVISGIASTPKKTEKWSISKIE